jgi:glycine cleavage system transcriptional repressor
LRAVYTRPLKTATHWVAALRERQVSKYSGLMSTRQYQVLTAVGRDRPGLVEKISGLLLAAGTNLEDSRMAILGGEFALILLFSGDETACQKVASQIDTAGSELGLTIGLKPTDRQSAQNDYSPYVLKVNGIDRPGIVARVSALLAGRGINVAALDSRISYAPLSGTPLFQLQTELQVPSHLGLSQLRGELGQLCDEENLDFVLESGRK